MKKTHTTGLSRRKQALLILMRSVYDMITSQQRKCGIEWFTYLGTTVSAGMVGSASAKLI